MAGWIVGVLHERVSYLYPPHCLFILYRNAYLCMARSYGYHQVSVLHWISP